MISVCMATYNGEKYVKSQLSSILKQLSNDDEIIVIDDCSNDDTIKCIDSIRDQRIKVLKNTKNMGVLNSFVKSLMEASGDIIFFSDQDDIWLDGKVKRIIKEFSDSDADIIQHDAIIVDENLKVQETSFFAIRNPSDSIIKNYISNRYLGCCMAFRSTVKKRLLPIPKEAAYHNSWIGIMGKFDGFKISFIKESLIFYVRHKNNVSQMKRRSLNLIIKDRMLLLKAILKNVFNVSKK